jgi:hypothetical protein
MKFIVTNTQKKAKGHAEASEKAAIQEAGKWNIPWS